MYAPKKEILDENGDVRKGCKIVKKDEVYERNLFTAKNKLFKQDQFVDEVKHFYTDLINTLALERDDLKGIAKFTKKGELQSRIDRKNEEIGILKIGLSGIAKRYGYQNVQEFYKIYHKSHSVYTAYKEQEVKWEKIYGTDIHKQDKENLHERLKKTRDYQQQTIKNKDRGAR